MSELPSGWIRTRLAEIVELKYGKSLPEKLRVPGPFSVFGSNGSVGTNLAPLTGGPTIVVGRKGSIGEVHFSTEPCFPIDTTYYIDHFEACDASFAFHLLKSMALADLNRATAIPGLNRDDAYGLAVALPPRGEQRRIVAKIDSLTAKSKRGRDHLDHIPRLVEKYKQAILAAAFEGVLTAEWRDRRNIGHNWPRNSIGSIVGNIVAGKNLRCEERPPSRHEKGVLKVSAVSWGEFDARAAKTLPAAFIPPENTRVHTGNFLFSRANTLELVGAVVIVGSTPDNLYLSDKVLRFDLDDRNKRWLLWFLRSPIGRQRLEATATGNQLSMRNISQGAVRSVEMPWPSVAERDEIVLRVETAFSWIDRLAAEATNARKLIDRLDQAILAKAFRGELVPQDPNDEPASGLLERIRAERAAAPPARGRGRRTAPIPAITPGVDRSHRRKRP